MANVLGQARGDVTVSLFMKMRNSCSGCHGEVLLRQDVRYKQPPPSAHKTMISSTHKTSNFLSHTHTLFPNFKISSKNIQKRCNLISQQGD